MKNELLARLLQNSSENIKPDVLRSEPLLTVSFCLIRSYPAKNLRAIISKMRRLSRERAGQYLRRDVFTFVLVVQWFELPCLLSHVVSASRFLGLLMKCHCCWSNMLPFFSSRFTTRAPKLRSPYFLCLQFSCEYWHSSSPFFPHSENRKSPLLAEHSQTHNFQHHSTPRGSRCFRNEAIIIGFRSQNYIQNISVGKTIS